MNLILKLVTIIVILCFSVNSKAQSAGDKLFKQGQELQMRQTIRSQRQAITKFTSAKKAYDSADKKAMCDNQIKICRNNIVTIRNNKEEKAEEQEVEMETVTPESAPKKEPVTLSLSVSAIKFKASGKKGDYHQVTINCNYTNWTYKVPVWVNVTKNGNVLTLTAAANDTGEERSDVLAVECEGTKAEVMLFQKSKFSLKSLIKKN